MAKIEIYTTPYCPYCLSAKALLERKGAAFTEIDVSRDPEGRRTMVERSHGGYTVPQIFIDGDPIGGSDELHMLERAGKLDPLLAGEKDSAVTAGQDTSA